MIADRRPLPEHFGTIIRLASVLEAPLHELIGGIDWKPAGSGPQRFEFRSLGDVTAE